MDKEIVCLSSINLIQFVDMSTNNICQTTICTHTYIITSTDYISVNIVLGLEHFNNNLAEIIKE